MSKSFRSSDRISRRTDIGFLNAGCRRRRKEHKDTGNATEKKEIPMGDLMKLVFLGGNACSGDRTMKMVCKYVVEPLLNFSKKLNEFSS